MKYELETTKLNEALKNYAWAIIIDSPHRNKWLEGTLKLFVDQFVADEITLGRGDAAINLKHRLEVEYTMT